MCKRGININLHLPIQKAQKNNREGLKGDYIIGRNFIVKNLESISKTSAKNLP